MSVQPVGLVKKTIKVKVMFNSKNYSVLATKVCPYCGTVIKPVFKTSSLATNADLKLMLVIFEAECCEKLFFSVYQGEGDEYILLVTYPQPSAETPPDIVTKLSPRFARLYTQASMAEYANSFELAGCGYRNALEVLIKDYAVVELQEPIENVEKKSFYEAIGEYLKGFEQSTSADVVRILGNSYTHYQGKYPDVPFSVYKDYVAYFISMLKMQLDLRHPPVPAPDRGLPKEGVALENQTECQPS